MVIVPLLSMVLSFIDANDDDIDDLFDNDNDENDMVFATIISFVVA